MNADEVEVLQHVYRQRLFFESGLYELVEATVLEAPGVFEEGARHDAYCVQCKRLSTFKLLRAPRIEVPYANSVSHHRAGVVVREFECSRVSSHFITFALIMYDKGNMKVGQWPSIAKIGQGALREYDPVLKGEDREELAKAIGLHAHGVGAGAFVYLRRILERFVREAEEGVDGALDSGARMVDRIAALRGKLPDFLTDNKMIYGILSKGIHELPEETCRAAFPVVRSALEQIIEEKLAAKRRADAAKRAEKNLAALQQELQGEDKRPSDESDGA